MMKKTIITFFVTFFYLNNAHGSENLTVSVASSLYNVSHELAREWEKTSNKKVVIISGSTSLLARQIERGQKSDVIITANYSWLKWMIDKNLIEKNSKYSDKSVVAKRVKRSEGIIFKFFYQKS